MTSYVKIIRKGLGISQKRMGDILGVSRTMIYNYESGDKAPCNARIMQLMIMAKELGIQCKAEDFFKQENLSPNSVDNAGEKRD